MQILDHPDGCDAHGFFPSKNSKNTPTHTHTTPRGTYEEVQVIEAPAESLPGAAIARDARERERATARGAGVGFRGGATCVGIRGWV